MITIKFHGPLKKLAPDPITVDCPTIALALDAATRQIPGFAPNPVRGRMALRVKECDHVHGLTHGTDLTEINVWPAMHGGGGKGGLIKIVIGIALIVASFYIPVGAGIGLTAAQTASVAGAVMGMGISLVLGGVMELFSAAPKMDVGAASNLEASKYLGSGGNTVRIGTRIPLLYGRHRAAGHFISFKIEAADVAPSAS